LGQELLKVCGDLKELHFDSITAQILSAKKLLIKHKLQMDKTDLAKDSDVNSIIDEVLQRDEVEFGLGDFAITKHSNLDHAQVLFHFVVEPPKSERLLKKDTDVTDVKKGKLFTSEQATKLNESLRNILQVCTEFEIVSLSLPIIFLEADNFSSVDESQLLRHIEANLKTIRTFLLQNTRSLTKALKNLEFILPKSLEGDLLMKVKKCLSSFRQT
jgi:hypothetical protein